MLPLAGNLAAWEVVPHALTMGAVEASRTWVSTVAGDILRAVIASRAGKAGTLTRQGAVGACTTGLWEAGPTWAEVPLGTGPSLF